jgi:hypothetical protein
VNNPPPPTNTAQPRTTGAPMTSARPPDNTRRNQLLILAAAIIVVVLIVRACTGGENKYEKIAHEFTQALQSNDYAAAVKLQNSETAAQMGHGRIGHAADVLGRLGKIKSVKENTPPNDGDRVHEFDVQFQNGAVHEKIKFDPDGKIYRFNYNVVTPAK